MLFLPVCYLTDVRKEYLTLCRDVTILPNNTTKKKKLEIIKRVVKKTRLFSLVSLFPI